jgi:DNA-binding CsgD family transcriptional regulator
MSQPDIHRDERILELTRRGYSTTQIAAIVGLTPRSVTRARRRAGISRPPATPAGPAERQWAAQLLADGASYSEVSRTLGRHIKTVMAWHPGASSWDHRAGGQLRAQLRKLNARLA